MMNLLEHDYEPVPGLPAPLPAGETILWQGAPDWKIFARRVMKIRLIAVYFSLLIVWGITGNAAANLPVLDIAISAARLAGLGVVALALLTMFAWLVARTTMYTITSRRVLIRFGIAFPITIQMAFPKIDSAGLHTWSDGSGDIALTLQPDNRIAYLVMWPHVRPWKMLKTQPTMRGIPDAAAVAQILGRALAASASQPATPLDMQIGVRTGGGNQVPAAA